MGEAERIEIHALEASRRKDFYRLHSPENGHGWCRCTAWWTPTWEGWGERSAEENQALRESLMERGEFDGYLLYVNGEPAGWCQVGRRDRLAKLVRQFQLPPDEGVWAITCFLIAPGYRGRGLATALLREVLQDLQGKGVRWVEAYPKRGEGLEAEDLWTGPEAMWLRAGFKVAREDAARPVLYLELQETKNEPPRKAKLRD
jgi:ribosomal protein S18 acetylase RimI-like enzyme